MSKADRKRLAAKLKARGVKRPGMVIAEALRAHILVASALAMLEMETGIPQRNIFGCDWGPGVAFCHMRVTKKRVARLIHDGRANGVGWTQLTYMAFVVAAQRMGGAAFPRYQMRQGFAVLRSNYDRLHSIFEMFRAYNGEGPAAEDYGRRAVDLRLKWLAVTDGR
jgi:hypothetical protein